MAKSTISFAYDKRADVLYLSVGKLKKSISREVQDGILVRFDPRTQKVTGITIMDFTARFKSSKPRAVPLNLEAQLQTI